MDQKFNGIPVGIIHFDKDYNIANHDDYRLRNPVEIFPKSKKKDSPPPKKGTRRYRSMQRKEENRARKHAIWRTLSLIEALHSQEAGMQPA